MTVSTSTNEITTMRLQCGATLVVEPIANVASAAMQWLLPLGSATDAPDSDGHAALLAELIFRGAGRLSSREHSDAFDRLGVQRSNDIGTHHLHLRLTMLGSKLSQSIPLAAAMLRQPAMPEGELDPVRSLCIQSLQSLDDDPQHLVMLRLRDKHHPPPFNRHGHGDMQVLERASIEALRSEWAKRCVPSGSIFAVAGAADPDDIARQLDELFAGWTGEHDEPKPIAEATRGRTHYQQETSQVHIALAYDAPHESHEHSMHERLATRVLSGSTSGRLFSEVRQKRSLCYSVGASYRAGRDTGHVSLYAGTTPERAQQTLDVCREEIQRMREGVQQQEFHRAVVGLKSQLIMSGESTAARAAALGYDHFRIGRARTLDEISAAVDAISLDQLNAYLAKREFGEFTIVSLGPVELT